MNASTHMLRVRAAAKGDDVALAALVRLYHDRVYRFGLRVCRDASDTDDAVQHAFTALAKRADVASDPGALAWLLTTVRNACIRLLRPFARQRRALGEPVDPDEAAALALSPEGALERFELVKQVHASIARLPEPYRQVIVLRDLEGLTGDETCAALHIELSTMKTRLHRARSMLRAELAPSYGAKDDR